MIIDNDLLLSDYKRLMNVLTYCSDNGKNTSWIDHVACSRVIDKCVQRVEVLYQFVTSDHKPITILFDGIQLSGCSQIDKPMHKVRYVHDWSKIDENIIFNYQTSLDTLLSTVPPPHSFVIDDVAYENDNHVLIDGYYNTVKLRYNGLA